MLYGTFALTQEPATIPTATSTGKCYTGQWREWERVVAGRGQNGEGSGPGGGGISSTHGIINSLHGLRRCLLAKKLAQIPVAPQGKVGVKQG